MMAQQNQPGDLKVALLQFDIAWEDPQANWNRIAQLLQGQEGLHDLIVLPEMFSTGFTMKPQGLAEAPGGDSEGFMRFLAGKTGAIIMGSLIVEEEGKFFNRLLVVGNEGPVLQYDKRHLFRMAGEHETYTAGAELNVFSLKGWRICPLICYDLRFPVWSRNGAAGEGRLWYDALVYVANWPERRAAHWRALLQARAIENQAWVLGLNRVGTDGNGISYSGDSSLIDALGNIVAHSAGEERLLTATLVWSELAEYREKFPAWRDADQFNLFG
jgi:predicted amidohydrolase